MWQKFLLRLMAGLIMICLVIVMLIVQPFASARILNNTNWQPRIEMVGGVDMVYVPTGCFWMGRDDGTERMLPRQPRCIEQPFWIDRFEVTNAQYAACVAAGDCAPPSDAALNADPVYAQHPVVSVNWQQANAYARWRGGCLPDETEWEYAARGPDSLVYPWGDSFVTTHAASAESQDQLTLINAPVGSHPGGVSWVGAHDLSGNVWEWTRTVYEDEIAVSGTHRAGCACNDSVAPDQSMVVRGGSLSNSSAVVQSASRAQVHSANTSKLLGFRVCRAS